MKKILSISFADDTDEEEEGRTSAIKSKEVRQIPAPATLMGPRKKKKKS